MGLTLHNLGVAHLNAARPVQATATLRRALAVLRAALPGGHPQLETTFDQAVFATTPQ